MMAKGFKIEGKEFWYIVAGFGIAFLALILLSSTGCKAMGLSPDTPYGVPAETGGVIDMALGVFEPIAPLVPYGTTALAVLGLLGFKKKSKQAHVLSHVIENVKDSLDPKTEAKVNDVISGTVDRYGKKIRKSLKKLKGKVKKS